MIRPIEILIENNIVLFCVEYSAFDVELMSLEELKQKLNDELNEIIHPPKLSSASGICFSRANINPKIESVLAKYSETVEPLLDQKIFLENQVLRLKDQIEWLAKTIEVIQSKEMNSFDKPRNAIIINDKINKEYLMHFDKTKYERIPLFQQAKEIMRTHDWGALKALRKANKVNKYIPKDLFEVTEDNILQGFYNYQQRINTNN